jgi:predicted transcriptional regulator
MRRGRNVSRVSIALDNETERMVELLAKEEDRTASETIRSAIKAYFDLKKISRSLDIDRLKKFGEMLESEEHVLVDIDLWIKILDELNKRGTEDFYNYVREIGYNRGIQNRKVGLKDIYETLKSFEIGNWFKVKANGEAYTIILSTRSEQNILKIFLESMFEAQGIPIEIISGFRKLTIVKKK